MPFRLTSFLSFLFLILTAETKTICLNMIVKDEKPVIARCLNSVKPFIDYWVIVDTGSTDGTQEAIRTCLRDIPGELHEQAWVNFGHNRNEALRLAKGKGDYLLFIDADEELEGTLEKNGLQSAVYLAPLRLSRDPLSTCLRALLINNHLKWSWQGVLHESLKHDEERSFQVLEKAIVSAERRDGHRAQDPQKYLKDAHILEEALLKEPDNAEYVYYLAQSYYNAKELSLSLKNYEKRAQMKGWDQHTFWAKYYMGHLQELLGMDPQQIIKSYCAAFTERPTRAEPLCRLGNYFYTQKNYVLGYLLAQYGLTLPFPNDIVYVENWIYDYGLLAVFANCALEMGKHEEALSAYEKIAHKENVPASIREQAKMTITFLEKKGD